MQTLKYIKLVLIAPLLILVLYFLLMFIQTSQINPNIKEVKKISLNQKTIKNKTNIVNNNQVNEPQIISSSFNYKLIGYLAGPSDSSVILKKGSNEFLLRIGDEIDSYKLESVTKDEVIFSLQDKLYKIENNVGKNK